MALKQYTEVIKLIVALLLGAAFLWFGIYVNNLRNKAAQGEQRGQVIETTAGIVEDGAKSDVQRTVVEVDVSAAREEFNRQMREARQNDPETRTSSAARNPDSVLRAARERRQARERSVGAEGERGTGPAPAPAP